MASTAQSCCTLAPVEQNYTSKGEVVRVADFDVYLTGPRGAKHAIILHYDIFGDHPNTRQVADILGAKNFRVAIPDLFRGNPWPVTKWPPSEENPLQAVFAHVFKVAPFDTVKSDITATREFLAAEGSQSFGLLGFCWGGRNVCLLSADSAFSVGALVHPGAVTEEEADKVACPLIVLPAMDDSVEVFDKAVAVLKKKPFGEKIVYHRFTDVPHGFCASRSDFSNELMAKRANEALTMVHDFFVANFP